MNIAASMTKLDYKSHPSHLRPRNVSTAEFGKFTLLIRKVLIQQAYFQGQDSAIGYGRTSGESVFDSRQDQKFIFSPLCPDRLWGTPSPLLNRYCGILPGEQGGQDVKSISLLN